MKNQTWDLKIPLRHKMARCRKSCFESGSVHTLTQKDAHFASHILLTYYNSFLSGIDTTEILF